MECRAGKEALIGADSNTPDLSLLTISCSSLTVIVFCSQHSIKSRFLRSLLRPSLYSTFQQHLSQQCPVVSRTQTCLRFLFFFSDHSFLITFAELNALICLRAQLDFFSVYAHFLNQLLLIKNTTLTGSFETSWRQLGSHSYDILLTFTEQRSETANILQFVENTVQKETVNPPYAFQMTFWTFM